MENISLFVESNEELGILYNGYSPIADKVKKFLDLIEFNINKFDHNTKEYKVDLRSDINEFKKVVNSKIYPEELEVKEVSKYILLVKKFQNELDKLLKQYADLKDKMSFGGSLYRNKIKKPKALEPKNDPEAYKNISISLNNINRALDWAEKCLLDLFNLADQDMNLLTLLDKVYVKQHIFEGKELPHGVYDENEIVYEDSYRYKNSQDKETGDAPDYIKLNHKMASYIPGEEPEEEPKDLDDFKRASAKDDTPAADAPEKKDDFPEYKGPVGDDKNLNLDIPESSPEEKKADEEHKQQAVNNYYYYTYNNSMNKNSNSFNRDHSTHDDHHRVDKSSHYDYSKHTNTRNDDHSSSYDYSKNSKSSTDNHSNVKNTVNNYTNKSNDDIDHKDDNKDDKKEYHALEWTNPWELRNPAELIDIMVEDVGDDNRPIGDADDNRPVSDNPIRDTTMDIGRKATIAAQKVKRQAQQAHQAVTAVTRPATRVIDYINNTIRRWDDAKETEIKQRLADPHARSGLSDTIKKAIKVGSYYKAGLLWNPFFVGLAIYNKVGDKRKAARLRQEMIGELKTEIEIIDEKIKDADANHDNKQKYQLMRFKNELSKKLLRVDGGDRISKIL